MALYTQGVHVGQVFFAGQEAAFVFGRGTQIFPAAPMELSGACETRVVLDANQWWFEFGFAVDAELSGNSAAGWTDAGNYLRIEAEWSLDLVNWTLGKFLPAPVPVVNLGGGFYQYWSRSKHPVDSAVKSGMLQISSGAIYGDPGIAEDSRNNPFTALTVLNVVRNLGGFPYTMPLDAGRMQNDLAAIFPGATVESSSATVWRIRIPNITFSAFNMLNQLYWPTYLVADMYGVINTPLGGASLGGNFINADGIAIYTKAFARLKITAGTRYDPYR